MTETSVLPPEQQKSERMSRSILWYEGFGFLMIILLTWADTLLHLPYHLFGGEYQSPWRASLLQTWVVVLVWVVVHRMTSKVLRRLHYLERMLRMCAWCRKIGDGDDWVPMEEYVSTKFDMRTSHGVCPECAEKIRADFRQELPESTGS